MSIVLGAVGGNTRVTLLVRIRDGSDRKSWKEFHAQYAPMILELARQEGLQVMPRFQYDSSRGRFRSWLKTVTRNSIVDWKRKRRKGVSIDEEVHGREEWRGWVEGERLRWEEADRRETLRRVMEEVRRESRDVTWQCFERHTLQGMRAAEVGAELGLSAGAVYVNASRVLSRVKARLAEQRGGTSDE